MFEQMDKKIIAIFGSIIMPMELLTRDFPRPDLRPNNDPFPIKKWANLPKMTYIIPNFFVLYFMKIWTKIPKLQMHENLHNNVNENMFSFTF